MARNGQSSTQPINSAGGFKAGERLAPTKRLRYGRAVARTVILSEDTMSALLEAHASLAAWYYRMAGALRAAGTGVEPPSDDERRAFLAQLGEQFPEVAAVARAITSPRPYLPPPAFPAPARVTENEGVVVAPPPPAAASEPTMPAPPPPVDPAKVRYE
jgi:hypothetical protein